MRINNKKQAFTLIELMSVIGIVVILIATLIPTVSGYINRPKKLNVVIQSRNIVNFAVSNGIDATSNVKLSELVSSGTLNDYEGSVESLQDDIQYSTLRSITKDENAINKIKIGNGKIIEWTGENPYKKE